MFDADADWRVDLERWLAPFLARLSHPARRAMCPLYVAGLIGPGGGYATKACVIADGAGRAIAFRIAPGQAHELPHVIPLLDRLPGVPNSVVADRGCTSHAFRQRIWDMGSRHRRRVRRSRTVPRPTDDRRHHGRRRTLPIPPSDEAGFDLRSSRAMTL